jgi:hypothetical protein
VYTCCNASGSLLLYEDYVWVSLGNAMKAKQSKAKQSNKDFIGSVFSLEDNIELSSFTETRKCLLPMGAQCTSHRLPEYHQVGDNAPHPGRLPCHRDVCDAAARTTGRAIGGCRARRQAIDSIVAGGGTHLWETMVDSEAINRLKTEAGKRENRGRHSELPVV